MSSSGDPVAPVTSEPRGVGAPRGRGTPHAGATAEVASEAGVLAALRRGDERTFVALVDRNHAAMLRLAIGFVHNRATADEVVQESWLGFLTGLERFEARSSLRTFLLTIVANRARTRATRDRRMVPLSSLAPEDGEDGPAVPAERFLAADHDRWPGHWAAAPRSWATLPERRLLDRETFGVLHAAIDALPARQRAVILLHDVHGLSATETRQALELTESNQRVLLHRARNRVRAALEAYLEPAEAAR